MIPEVPPPNIKKLSEDSISSIRRCYMLNNSLGRMLQLPNFTDFSRPLNAQSNNVVHPWIHSQSAYGNTQRALELGDRAISLKILQGSYNGRSLRRTSYPSFGRKS